MAKGWISLHREIQEHWLWQEKREFSKLEAWFDILLTVNHSEQKLLIKNTLFIVKRGESIKSLDTWAYRWNWNKSKVRRFLKMLENDSMIVTKNERKTTRLTVCKYDNYQDKRNADETILKRKRNADETQVTPNNNDINNDINNIYNKFVEEVKSGGYATRIESIYMRLKIKQGSLTPLLKEFKLHLIEENREHKTTNELFINFKNWLNVQDRIKKLDKYR